jgi:CBS domain-containing protein
MFDFDVRSGRDVAEPEILWRLARVSRVNPLGEDLLEPISRVPRRPPLTLAPSTPVSETRRLLGARRAKAGLIASHGVLLGLVTEGQLLRHLVEHPREADGADAALVCRVMNAKPETLVESDSVAYAIRKLALVEGGIMPIVLSSGAPSGVLDCRDILLWICNRFGASDALESGPVSGNNS